MIIPIRKESEDVDLQLRLLRAEVIRLRKEVNELKNPDTIVIPYNGVRRFISLNNIVMIEADGNYSTIHLKSGENILTSRTLKFWGTKITNPDFIRSHASFLINCQLIQSIDFKERRVVLKNQCLAKISKSTLQTMRNLGE